MKNNFEKSIDKEDILVGENNNNNNNNNNDDDKDSQYIKDLFRLNEKIGGNIEKERAAGVYRSGTPRKSSLSKIDGTYED